MRKLLPLLFILQLGAALQAQSLFNIKPDAWLRADKPFSATIWPDASGNKMNAVISKGDTIIADGLINYNKAITFKGKSRFSIPFDPGTASSLTVITVYQTKDTLDEQGIWKASVNAGEITLSTQRATGPQGITRYSSNNIDFPAINTALQFWGRSSKNSMQNGITIGSTSPDLLPFEGMLSELMVFKRLLTDQELQIVQSYLSLKYGASLLYTDYMTSRGDVVWNYQSNSEFSWSIAGLGRDDGFSLNQKQSSSTTEPGTLVIGAGQIVSANEQNAYAFKNGEFLVWGHNGRTLDADTASADGDLYKFPIPAREWLMEVSGRQTAAIPTQLMFKSLSPGIVKEQCRLLIDRTRVGDFSSPAITLLTADSINKKGEAWFSNVKWDTDGSGSDLFTFSCGNLIAGTRDNQIVQSTDNNNSPGSSETLYKYKLFPNPSDDGNYTLDLTFGNESEVIVRIIDQQGKLVKEQRGSGSAGYIFRGTIRRKGIYIVEILAGTNRETFKLIVN